MKFSTTLLSLTTIAFMVMTVGSSGLRGRALQDLSVEASNLNAPNLKISGISHLLNILNAASNFTNSTFDTLTLNDFSKNLTDQGVVYDAKVTLANDQGFNVSGVINGTWDPSSGGLVLNVYGAETSASEGEGEEVNTTSPVPVPNGYTWIPPQDLASNVIASNALTWGIDALVARAISQYKLPPAVPEYNVTNLILAAYKNASYGSAYIFWTNLSNPLNYKIDANITIKYNKNNQNFTLAGYSFRSYGYPASAIVIPPPVTNTTGNNSAPSNGTVLPPDNTTVIIDNTTNSTNVFDNSTVVIPISTDNSTNVTVIVNDTVIANITTPSNETAPSNETTPSNTTVPVNETTPQTPQLTSDGYTIYTADQLANDSQAQTALQYGSNALIQKAISQNKVPAANPTYTVNNVGLAAYKKQPIGTYYKFQVNMTNADYVHVDANLTIQYRYSTQAYSLNGYSFHSYNYSSKALGNSKPNNATSIVNATTSGNLTGNV